MKRIITIAALATLALADKDKQPFGKIFESIDKAGKGLINGLNNFGKAFEHRSSHADDMEDEEFLAVNLATKLKDLEKEILRHPELLKKFQAMKDDVNEDEFISVPGLAQQLKDLEREIYRHPELLKKYPTAHKVLFDEDEDDDELALIFKPREIQSRLKPNVHVATGNFLRKDLAVEAVQPEVSSLRKLITFEDDSLSFLEKLLKLDDETKAQQDKHSQQGNQGPKNTGRGKINF